MEHLVSLSAEKAPLRTVVEKLAAQAGMKAEFDIEALQQVGFDLQQPVTATFDNLPLSEALNRVIDWSKNTGVMRHLRGQTLRLTTLAAWQAHVAQRLPEWLKPLYRHGLSATLDENDEVATITASGKVVTDEFLAKLAALPNLRELHIEVTKSLTAQGLAQLAKTARLKKLSLYSVNSEGLALGDDAIRNVAGLTSLRELSISECGTTDAGAKLLERMPQLTSLSLRQEGRLTDAALASIGKLTRLQSLSLNTYVGTKRFGWMRFSAAGVRRLSGLKELRALHLVGQAVPADALNFPKLTSLSLGHADVVDAAAARIGELRALTSLELVYCSIGDSGLKAIAALPELRRLNISSQTISDAGVERLRNSRLEHLTLRVGGLTDRSLEYVSDIKSLRRLDLYGSGRPGVAPGRIFTAEGLKHLQRLPNLQTLWLNNFDLRGGYTVLRELKHLRELSMTMCDITKAELEILLDAMPNVRISHMTGGGSWLLDSIRKGSETPRRRKQPAAQDKPPRKPPRKGLEFLAAYPKLRDLSLKMTRQQFLDIVKREGLKAERSADGSSYSIPTNDGHLVIVMFNGDKCGGVQRLRGGPAAAPNNARNNPADGAQADGATAPPDLRLEGAQVTVDAVKTLAGEDWGTVTLADARFDGAVIEALRHAKSIRTLRLFGQGFSGQIPRLQHVAGLVGLELGGPLIGRDLQAIGELTRLERLALPQELIINVTGARSLAKLIHLKSLGLYNVDIDDASFAQLKPLAQLEELDLTHTRVTDSGLSVLAAMPRLKRLELDRHPAWLIPQQLSDKCVPLLAKLTDLQELSLSGAVTDAGLKQLAGLPKLKRLMILNTQITGAGLAALANSPVETLVMGPMGLEQLRRPPGEPPTPAELLRRVPALASLRKLRALKHVAIVGELPPINLDSLKKAVPGVGWSFQN